MNVRITTGDFEVFASGSIESNGLSPVVFYLAEGFQFNVQVAFDGGAEAISANVIGPAFTLTINKLFAQRSGYTKHESAP